MTDFYCPQHIKDMFVTSTDTHIPDVAYRAFMKWAKSLPVKRGDRIECYGTPDSQPPHEWVWWEYDPDN